MEKPQIAKRIYKRCSKSGQNFWKALQAHHNSSKNELSSPAQRLYSRRLRSNIPMITSQLKPEIQRNVSEEIRNKRQKAKQQFDKTAKRLPIIEIGQDVYFQRNPENSSNWSKGSLTNTLNERSSVVTTENGQSYRRNRIHIRPATEVLTNTPMVEQRSPDENIDEPNTSEAQKRRQPGRIKTVPIRFKDYDLNID